MNRREKNRAKTKESILMNDVTQAVQWMTSMYLTQKRNSEIMAIFKENISKLPETPKQTIDDFERIFITFIHTIEVTHRIAMGVNENEIDPSKIYMDDAVYSILNKDENGENKNLKYLIDKLIEKNVIILRKYEENVVS